MNQLARSRVGLLLTCAVCCLVVFVAFSQQEDKPPIDPETYNALMAAQVFSAGDLQDFYLEQRDGYVALLPPDAEFVLRQGGVPDLLPFDPKSFPAEFTEALVPVYENSVPVYPLTLAEDFTTRETYFLNADGKEVYALPALKDYNPYAFLEERYPDLFPTAYDSELTDYLKALYDPARIEIQVKLIAAEDVEPYLYAQAQIAEAAAQMQSEFQQEGGGGMMLLDEEETNHLWLSIQGPAQGLTNIEIQAHIPAGFTNAIEMFTGTNLLSFWWTLAATNLVTEGTDTVYWTYELTEDMGPVFFAAGKAGVDSDNDGLTDAREKFLYHTDPNLADTDGDGFSDYDEIFVYFTDPLDKYSVPPLDMMTASGSSIVDESGNPVVLKAVNLGGWLVLENWLTKFQPTEFRFTNYALTVVNNDFDEATMREMLVQNVDYEVVLVAEKLSASNGVTRQTWSGKMPPFIGDFDANDWIAFSNVNFGAGVSNLTFVLAESNAAAGKFIDVRVDDPLTGRVVCTHTVEGTGYDWDSIGAQTEENITLSGTQTVYFVGRGGGGIANLLSFRFYRDTNARQLIETFRNAYLQTNDLDRIKELGYNCVRVPFGYSLIQDETGTNYLVEGWNRLDTLLSECAKRRIWVILDLHSTPGGQNWYEHCGQPNGLRNRLWTNPKCQDRTVHLWNTVAARYSNNTTVAGYDLFNEPDPSIGTKAQSYSNYIVPLHDRIYKSIRSNDTRHLIFMEDNWHATNNAAFAFNHPRLQDKGWSNVVFELHHYERVLNGTSGNDWTFDAQKGVMDENVRLYATYMKERQVPVFAGEFCPGDPRNMEYFVRRFDASGINWANWNWRNWGWTYTNDPARGWDGWGLEFRTDGICLGTNYAIQPNVRTDSVETLSEKLSGYNYQSYTDHSQLRKVIQNHAANTNVARERTQFYLNTFNGAYADNLAAGWNWKKIAAVGPRSDAFQTIGSRAHVVPGYGSLVMRYRTREELDARFEINDSTGCWFSFEPWTFNVTNVVATNECELRLCVTRDEISSPSYNYNCPGIIARLLYDRSASSTNVTIYLFSKNGGTNTYGLPLYQSAAIPFVAGEPLRLFVNQTNATVVYATVTNTVTHTNLALSTWAEGAVCLVEAENNGGVDFVELDNFKAWRLDATSDQEFSVNLTGSPNGMTILSEPEHMTMPTYWAPSRKSESYITNGSALLFPEEKGNGSSWLSPRRDYQNDVRIDLSTTSVVEVRAAWSDFTSGWGKMCLVSELFPGTIYSYYTTNALYVQIERTNANDIIITGYRHMGVDGNRQPLQSTVVAYQNGQLISMQVDNTTMQVFYGTTQVINTPHGLTNAYQFYANGAYPHLEIQNYPSVTNASVLVDSVVCRRLATFEVPSP